jgi:ABC-2 type transport system permease protein
MAAMADNVPAVQALGQCIFLPMLIIGGVAVPLTSLPDWALHVSAFFPGRYAVAALQSGITGIESGGGFDFLALVLIGAAGFAAGGWMFRWEPQQRFSVRGKGWLVLVIAACVSVGAMAEWRGDAKIGRDQQIQTASYARPQPPSGGPPSWKSVTIADILNYADFDSLPPDSGIISPIARPGDDPPFEIAVQLQMLTTALPAWPPGRIADPVQRVRNLLYVPAVPDVLGAEILEGYVPLIVFDRLQQEFPKEDLIRLLYWVATHPSDGDDGAARQIPALDLGNAQPDLETVRERVRIYGLKLLGRLTGRLPRR